MKDATPSAGDPVVARCTKCRKNTHHTILAMEEGAPARVECGLCNRQHKYRPPSIPKKPASKRAVDPKEDARKEWTTLFPGMNAAKATDYSMEASYKRGTLMKHPLFGLGLVQRIVGHRKVEVLFEEGRKTMRCK